MKTKCTPRTAAAIGYLREALREEFGTDFAFSIMGKGHKVAASNKVDGTIKPEPGTSHTPNGYDPQLVECLNATLRDRGNGRQIQDLEEYEWFKFLGPLCDYLEDNTDAERAAKH